MLKKVIIGILDVYKRQVIMLQTASSAQLVQNLCISGTVMCARHFLPFEQKFVP